MADKAYYVPAVVYRFLPLIYISAGGLALFNAANPIGTISSLLLIGAGLLTFIWRCRAAASRRRRRGRSPSVTRAGSLRSEYDYPHAASPEPGPASTAGRPPNAFRRTTKPTAPVIQPSTSPAHKTGRAALFENPRLNRRRNRMDRRGWEPMPDAPFRDSAGAFVKRDRRRLPERRKNSIEVREVSEGEGDPL